MLRHIGVRHVLGSRETAFVEQLAQLGGVDVILSSLTSPGMLSASTSVLKPGGRLVEIGKRDIWTQHTMNRCSSMRMI